MYQWEDSTTSLDAKPRFKSIPLPNTSYQNISISQVVKEELDLHTIEVCKQLTEQIAKRAEFVALIDEYALELSTLLSANIFLSSYLIKWIEQDAVETSHLQDGTYVSPIRTTLRETTPSLDKKQHQRRCKGILYDPFAIKVPTDKSPHTFKMIQGVLHGKVVVTNVITFYD